ncbi:hypothetical protein MESS2_1030096 [Mesorhizobium metallidurans STM 2683]|uniref:Uncharacterized protein n=1 Tax=Mesorhizobium metallidurans STM 2683 TaxID=1297569 RepID=M5EEY6_9HYPH|nr:hypothetical protein MESS2_1030096 [Mesorhizobium metallidurans STM 2683]
MTCLQSQPCYCMVAMRQAQGWQSPPPPLFAKDQTGQLTCYQTGQLICLRHTPHGRLETRAGIVYISLKFLVGMTKSGSTRSRSFLLPAGQSRKR